MEIKCEFQEVNWISGDGLALLYMCTVKSANIKDPFHTIKAFSGAHVEGKSHADVKRICFENTIVEYFPNDLYKHFPNLTHLSISNCGLKRISRQDLKGLVGLMTLGIRKCSITSLDDDLFVGLPNLRSVFLDNNKIKYASSEVLKPLLGRSKVTVNLVGNVSINSYFHTRLDGSVTSVESLMEVIDKQCTKPVKKPKAGLSFFTNGESSTAVNPKIKDLWSSGRFSDLNIVVGSKDFRVHKTILAMRSTIFAQIFDEDEVADQIQFKEYSEEAVETLLHYIYTEEVKEAGNAMENFAIAQKFKLDEMKSIWEKKLILQLTESNAFEFFMFGDQQKSETLKQAAFHRIALYLKEDLPAELMDNPEKLKRLIDSRREYEKLLGE